MNDQDHKILKNEGEFFYKKIFRRPALPEIIKEYVRANKHLLEEEERTSLKKLTSKRADIEAIEIAWRFKHEYNLLTKKIHILLYVSEAVPQNYELFINEKNRKFISFFSISFNFFRSVYKFLKGKILLKRYRLV